MAHPLTQHPPSSLPFASGSRPSPLSFGFGHPSSPASYSLSHLNSPVRPALSGASTPSGPSAFPTFTPPASTSQSHLPFASPSYKGKHRPSPTTFKSDISLKRSRKSSTSSDTSTASPRSSLSPHQAAGELPRTKDELSFGRLELKDEADRRFVKRKIAKRSRQETGVLPGTTIPNVGGDGDDVGILLAALPQSSHLSILINILQAHPSLNAEILGKLPQLDNDECLVQLDTILSRVKRKAGSTVSGLDPGRAWARAEEDINTYCRTATAYLRYFTSPSSTSSAPPEPQSIHTLLNTISIHLYACLQLIPLRAETSASTSVKAVLELGKLIVSTFSNWVNDVSLEVNQKGGMFSYNTVELWASNLDVLSGWTSPTAPAIQPIWGAQPVQQVSSHPLVESFRSAIEPIRDRFISELGWLIGRHNPMSATRSSMAPVVPRPSFSSWNSAPVPISAGVGMAQDEDL